MVAALSPAAELCPQGAAAGGQRRLSGQTPDAEKRNIVIDATGTWQYYFPVRADDVVLMKLTPGGVAGASQ